MAVETICRSQLCQISKEQGCSLLGASWDGICGTFVAEELLVPKTLRPVLNN